jgi:hypothetical protein
VASVERTREAAGERSPHPAGTAASSPVLAYVATPPPASTPPSSAPLTPAPPPMPAPMPPPVPPAPTGSCTTGAAGSHATGGGQHGGSAQDPAVLGGQIPAPSLSADASPHGSDVDPVTPRADDPGSSPD